MSDNTTTRKAGVFLKDAGGLPPIKNRYEAAIPGSPDRPYLPAFVRDARYDANSFTRWELCRKARYERRNNWLMKRLQSVDARYTVGPHGHVIIPESSDPEWNKNMEEAYLEWCESPFRDSLLPMFQGHQLARKEMHIDGEVFENLTYIKMPGQASIPAVELVESHRVSSPGQDYEFTQDGADIVDGVQLQRDAGGKLFGRPTGYYVRVGMDGESWTSVRAFDPHQPIAGGMIHTCDPDRIGMARVVSEYAPVLNEIQDLFTLSDLEMDRAKANSEVAALYETWNGELPNNFSGGSRPGVPPSGFSSLPVPGAVSDADMKKRVDLFRKIISSRWIGLKPGEKVTFPENPSPSAATQWLWQFYIERVAITRNIPMFLVLPESVQGTVFRGIQDDAQIGFIEQFSINARAARAKYRFFAAWARYNNPKLKDPPADWMKCRVVPPPAINVDFGRNMNALLAGIDAGVFDYDDVIGKDGSTAELRFVKKARNVAKAKLIAEQVSREFGVEVKPEEIIGNLAEIAAKLSPQSGGDEDLTQSKPKSKQSDKPFTT